MLNHISIMGRMGKDPELRRTNNGNAVTSFTLAVDRDFKNANGEKVTDWIECVAFKHTAEFAEKYFKKGSMAIVAGKLQTRSWEDKNGNRRKSTEINVENIYFGESKKDNGYGTTTSASTDFAEIDDDFELPF